MVLYYLGLRKTGR